METIWQWLVRILPLRAGFAWWRFKRRLSGTNDFLIADRALKELSTQIYAAGIFIQEAKVTLEGFVRIRCVIETKEQAEAYREICARIFLKGHLCEACLKKSQFILLPGREDDLEDA